MAVSIFDNSATRAFDGIGREFVPHLSTAGDQIEQIVGETVVIGLQEAAPKFAKQAPGVVRALREADRRPFSNVVSIDGGKEHGPGKLTVSADGQMRLEISIRCDGAWDRLAMERIIPDRNPGVCGNDGKETAFGTYVLAGAKSALQAQGWTGLGVRYDRGWLQIDVSKPVPQ